MKDDIVIVGAARTAVGAFNGALAGLPAHELGKLAITSALIPPVAVYWRLRGAWTFRVPFL